MLGMAAEAELEQQQQQLSARQLQPAYTQDGFARPTAKKQRLGGPYTADHSRYENVQQHMYPGLSRAQQQWQHSSSSSQSAGGHYGMAGLLDGHSPISPPGQRGFQPFRPPSNLGMGAAALGMPYGGWAGMQQQQQRAGQRLQQQQQQQHARGRSSALDPADSQGEFLPWEQLLSGIQAIKTQGPPLFKQSSVAPPAQRPAQQPRQNNAAAFGSCGSKFGRLLDLVGQVQPDDIPPPVPTQQRRQPPAPLPPPQPQVQVQPPPPPLPPQQPQQPQQRVPVSAPQAPAPLAAAGSGSLGGSSTGSTLGSQLPLFRAVNAQMSALLLQQQAQQQSQTQQQLVSPGARAQQQQHRQMLPPPAVQQQGRMAASPAEPATSKPPSPGAAGAGAVAGQTQPVGSAATAGSFTKPGPAAVAVEQQQQQPLAQVVPDCVRAAVPDADSRAAAVACCAAPPAGALGTAGSGGSIGSADSALASAAAAAAGAAVQPMQPAAAGIVDLRQAQAVAQ
jgi:hypothetical protein